MQFATGQVFSLYCSLCTPQKQKLFVVALLDPFRCFLINSRPSPFQGSSPKQMACLAMILQCEHAFLVKDSLVACTEISAEHSELSISNAIAASSSCYKGVLSANARTAVARALRDNRL